MMSLDDESSRDSGICDMQDDAPTCFSSMQSTYESNLMEIDEDESVAAVEPPQSKTRKSCRVRLFDESPTSHTMFARPGLNFRDVNQEPSTHRVEHRKRVLDEESAERRPSKHCHLDLEDVDQQCMSTEVARVELHSDHFELNVAADDVDFDEEEEDPNHLVVKYRLKTIPVICSTSYRRISAETLCDLMHELKDSFSEQFVLVDCRYQYEYDGGHIKTAVNFYERDKVSTFFFEGDRSEQRRIKQIPIFYCEYSEKRGPGMAKTVRRTDRDRAVLPYPQCSYEEMYVLDKGYRNFYELSKSKNLETLCEPQNYVQMWDPKYSEELKKHNYHKKAASQPVIKTESQDSFFARSVKSSEITDCSTPPRRRGPAVLRRRPLQEIPPSPTNYSRPPPTDRPVTPPSGIPPPLPQFT